MSMCNHSNWICFPQEDKDYGNIEQNRYDDTYSRCKNNKSKSCLIKFMGDRRKVYLHNDDTLTINCKKGEETYDEDGDYNHWRYYYIKLNRGLYECENCEEHFDKLNDDNECRECCYADMINHWRVGNWDMYMKQQKYAVKLISKAFLECKYNPEYKYCKDRMNDLYDREYDEDYVEGEKIFIKNLLPVPKLKRQELIKKIYEAEEKEPNMMSI